jgi:hypothetical protein
MIPGRLLAAPAVVLLMLGLVGCGSPAPAASPGPVDPTASDVPVVEQPGSGERPDSATDATCNDLTTATELDPLFAVTVDLAPPTRTAEYIGAAIADEWAIRQAGGVACEWSDPEGITTSEGRYHPGIQVWLVPASGPQWQEFSDTVGDGTLRRYECNDYGGCDLDQYWTTGWWLRISAYNIDALASPTAAALRTLTSPVFEAIAARVGALPAPPPLWAPPVPELAFGGGCTGPITGARLASALGMSSGLAVEELGYPRPAYAATLTLGGSDCRWARASDGWDIAYIQVLPGGAWAQTEAKAAMLAVSGSVPSPAVPGVPAGATALYQHVDSWAMDVVLGGSWIKIAIGNGSDTGGMSSPDALVAIATQIAAGA